MHCFISGCPNGCDGPKDQKKARMVQIFFTAPEDESLFRQWQLTIPRSTNRIFSRGDKLCDLHFKKSEVVLFNETKLPNGNVRRVPALEPKLKAGTIPSIFPKGCKNESEADKNKESKTTTVSEIQKSRGKRKLSSDDLEPQETPSRPRGRPRKVIPEGNKEKTTTPVPEKRKKIDPDVEPLETIEEKQYKEIESDDDSNEELSQATQPTIRLVPLASLLDPAQTKKEDKEGQQEEAKASKGNKKRKQPFQAQSPSVAVKKKKIEELESIPLKPIESRKKVRENIEEVCAELELAVTDISDDEGAYEIEHTTDIGDEGADFFEIGSIKNDCDDVDQKKTLEELAAELGETDDPDLLYLSGSSSDNTPKPRITQVISLCGMDEEGNLIQHSAKVDNVELEMAKILGEDVEPSCGSDLPKHKNSGKEDDKPDQEHTLGSTEDKLVKNISNAHEHPQEEYSSDIRHASSSKLLYEENSKEINNAESDTLEKEKSEMHQDHSTEISEARLAITEREADKAKTGADADKDESKTQAGKFEMRTDDTEEAKIEIEDGKIETDTGKATMEREACVVETDTEKAKMETETDKTKTGTDTDKVEIETETEPVLSNTEAEKEPGKAKGEINAGKAETETEADKAEAEKEAAKAKPETKTANAEPETEADKAEAEKEATKAEPETEADIAETVIKTDKAGTEPLDSNDIPCESSVLKEKLSEHQSSAEETSDEGDLPGPDNEAESNPDEDYYHPLEDSLPKENRSEDNSSEKNETVKGDNDNILRKETEENDIEEVELPSSGSSVILDVSSDSEADATWAPGPDTIVVSDENDTDPGSNNEDESPTIEEKRRAETISSKSPIKIKSKAKNVESRQPPTVEQVAKILNPDALKQILSNLTFPLNGPVALSIADGSTLSGAQRTIIPKGGILHNENSPSKFRSPRRAQISGERSKKCAKLLGLKMFEGLGKIKKAFDFSTFLSDPDDELQFKKFCLLLRECLRDVCESKNAVTNIGKLTVTISHKTLRNDSNPLSQALKNAEIIPHNDSLQDNNEGQTLPQVEQDAQHQSSSTIREVHHDNTDDAEMFECMTVDSNVENHYESGPSIENAIEEQTAA